MAPVFIPAFAGMILTVDALAAALLFNLYRTDGAPLFLAGGIACLINALLIGPWALMFPGVISVGGTAWNEQSSPWLLLAWHFTFPLAVVAGTLWSHAPARASRRPRATVLAIAVSFTIATLLVLTVTGLSGKLPAVLRGPLFLPDWRALTVAAAITNLIACGCVLRARPLSGVHLWLGVAMIAAALDMYLNALSPARFSVTWYVGKVQSLVTASSVLIALLAAWSTLRTRSAILAGQLSLFNLVVEAAPSAMVLTDEHGRITLVNARTEKFFGYTRDELRDQSIELLVPDRVRSEHRRLRTAFGRAPVAREMGAGRDLRGRRKDGSEVSIEIGLNPISTAGRLFTLAAITDITERKALEELRQFKADAQLAAAQQEAERERTWSTAFVRAVLPADLPRVTGCSFEAMYEPGRGYGQVGGDWYDAIRLVDGRVVVSIGDVCGSGLNAAVVVGVVRQVMRGIAQLHANPSVILDAADRALCLEYPDVLVSAWVGLIDLVTRTITFASAGHPSPLVVSAQGHIRELSDPATMLIGLRDGYRGQPNTAEIMQDDTLVLFTDGVIEATHDILAGLQTLHAAAASVALEKRCDTAAAIGGRVIPDGSSDDAAILVVRTDCSEAEHYIERWRFDVSDQYEASAVRAQLVDSMKRRNFSTDDCANAELILGELIGNVLRHASGTRRVDVVVDHRDGNSVLHVMDRGAGFYHVGRLPSDPYAESGRGLFLIGALTTDFTVSERLGGGSHARAVLRGGSRAAAVLPKALRMNAMA